MNQATSVSDSTSQITNDPTPADTAGNPVRCMHRWPSGRRCRQATEHPNSSFCSTHAAIEQNRHRGDRLYDLLQSDNNLLTASEINKSLASLYFLLAEDKISARRAAVLAYISHLLLRTLPAVEREESPEPPQLILDLPRLQTGTPSNASPAPRDADRPNHNMGIAPEPSAKQQEQPDPYDGYRPPQP